MVFDSVLKTIAEKNLIETGDKIVVAVSGGPDSVCLLHILHRLSNQMDISLFVAHLNHQIRGLEAHLDSLYVMKLCDSLNIPCFIKSIDVPKYCEDNKVGLEDGARMQRYKMFNEIKAKVGANKVAIGHNKNDQVETVLMRIMRGTGLQGLRGIEYKRDDGIIRPILDLNRKDIEKYCVDHELYPRIDKTNLESIYSRNKIRLELIPYIQKEFNENFIDSAIRMVQNLRSDSDYILNEVDKEYSELARAYEDGVYLFVEKFNTLHNAIKSRLVIRGIRDLVGDVNGIEKKHIDEVLEMSKDDKLNKKINLPRGIFVYRKQGYILLSKSILEDSNIEYEYTIEPGKDVFISELGKTFKSEIVSRENFNSDELKKGLQFLDLGKIKSSIRLRNRRQGDKIRLSGGTKKIKELFIGLKIPRENRDKVPILVDGDSVVAVCDYRMSIDYKIEEKTEKVLMFTLE